MLWPVCPGGKLRTGPPGITLAILPARPTWQAISIEALVWRDLTDEPRDRFNLTGRHVRSKGSVPVFFRIPAADAELRIPASFEGPDD